MRAVPTPDLLTPGIGRTSRHAEYELLTSPRTDARTHARILPLVVKYRNFACSRQLLLPCIPSVLASAQRMCPAHSGLAFIPVVKAEGCGQRQFTHCSRTQRRTLLCSLESARRQVSGFCRPLAKKGVPRHKTAQHLTAHSALPFWQMRLVCRPDGRDR